MGRLPVASENLTAVSVDRRAEQFRQFLLLDIVTTATSVVAVLVIWLTVFDNNWLLLAAGLISVAGMLMTLALIPLREGKLQRALVLLAVANWGAALSGAALATFAWPMMTLAALLPAVFAVPYVNSARLRVFVATSVAVSVAAALLGLLQDFSGLTDDAPDWIPPAVLIAFTPFMSLLVAQAGLASSRELQAALDEAVDANDELEASRARVVAATDRERRRIERDLHDGAQQRLVGMSVHISMARETAHTDPDATAAALTTLREQVREAQRELRELVRGVYPPVLTEHGLPAALHAVADELHVPVDLDIKNVGRFDVDIEAALYFCVLEAVQNAIKHAGAEPNLHIALEQQGSTLVFRVADDGVGFAGTDRLWGSGLVNMNDRLGAARGTLVVDSEPGQGTVVEGRVPTEL